jgi:hypothetical protein
LGEVFILETFSTTELKVVYDYAIK